MASTLDALRNPEYTGENRCTPCTIVNVAIAAVASALVSTVSVPLAVATFALALVVIALQGYLIPGTPTLTKRYLPERVLRWFDKAPEPTGEYDVHGGADEDVDVEAALVSLGAVEECPEGDDLCLTSRFRERWQSYIEEFRGTEGPTEALAEVLDVDPDRITLNRIGEATVVARVDDHRTGRWESHAAFVADMAAEQALRDHTDEWASLPVERRSGLLWSLRVFLERCPECGGPLWMGEDTVESCCRSWEVVANTCEECDARLLEVKASNLTPAEA